MRRRPRPNRRERRDAAHKAALIAAYNAWWGGSCWTRGSREEERPAARRMVALVERLRPELAAFARRAVQGVHPTRLRLLLENTPRGVFDLEICRVCGCTDNDPCEGGCWWVADDLCSACEEEL